MKILLSLLCVFSTASLFGDDVSIRPSWSGSWFNPEQSGHGINVQNLDDERTVIYWYTYDLEGKPFWLEALGVNSEVELYEGGILGLDPPGIKVEATAYHHEGMIHGEFDPATNNRQEWGTIVLVFPYDMCDFASMEWHPVMAGFSHGSTWLQRLTTLNGLDCVHEGDTAGIWEVQFEFDAEHRYQVEIVGAPDQEPEDPSVFIFEFLDETGCLWSGAISQAFGLHANWGNHCGVTAVEHWVYGSRYFEHKLCDSKNECVRKDEVMVFEDGEAYLVFSR